MILDKTKSITYDYANIKNVLSNVPGFYNEIKTKFTLTNILIKNSHRLELVAEKLYGDPNYEWIILLINELIDPFWSWPQTDDMIYKMSLHKYSSLDTNSPGIYEIHHHYDPIDKTQLYFDLVEYPNESKYFYHVGDITHTYPQFIGDLVPITNMEYELQINEDKKLIKVIDSIDVKNFVEFISTRINN